MCRILAILCVRIPLRERVITKIEQLDEVKPEFALPIVSIINALGVETVTRLFVPNASNFLTLSADLDNENLTYELLVIINLRRGKIFNCAFRIRFR